MDRKTAYALLAGLAATLLVIWGGIALLLGHGFFRFSEHDAGAGPVIFYAAGTVLGILLFLVVGIGIYVYRDARQRGMPALLWTAVAVFVPYFIGLVVYLVARQLRQSPCPHCGGPAPADALFCPRCGKSTTRSCPACSGRVPPDGRFCPACGAAMEA